MDDKIDINSLPDIVDAEELEELEKQISAKDRAPFEPQTYLQVFHLPSSGEWRVDALFPEGYFRSAELLLKGIVRGELRKGIEGVAAIFLSRHYLELEIKYTLFHSRWLKSGSKNAPDIDVAPVGKTHKLQSLWETLVGELNRKTGLLPAGLDINFVSEFVKEFHAIDEHSERFRYPGKQLAVGRSARDYVRIDYAALLFDLQRVDDILTTLDTLLIETFGQNEEWEAEQQSWL